MDCGPGQAREGRREDWPGDGTGDIEAARTCWGCLLLAGGGRVRQELLLAGGLQGYGASALDLAGGVLKARHVGLGSRSRGLVNCSDTVASAGYLKTLSAERVLGLQEYFPSDSDL